MLNRKNISKSLFKKVDIASIVVFRIAFGLLMLWDVLQYFNHNWIKRFWITPNYNFPLWPFLSLRPLEGNGMYYLFIVMGMLSVLITLGLFYRVSMLLFSICFTYMFLLDQTLYLNHFYLIILICFVMLWIPAHRSLSLDAKWFGKKSKPYVLGWHLWLLRFMIAIPFFFGGVAKINSDWLSGQPLGIWLSKKTDFPIIGSFFTEKWMILFMSYSGLLIDLLIVPFLVFKKTRIWAFTIGFLFHFMNSQLFNIGVFPWFMIAATSLFFSPSWPRVVVNKIFKKQVWPKNKGNQVKIAKLSRKQKFTVAALCFWTLLMISIPLRHLLIPGNVSWTEAGHKFAWRMKLNAKKAHGKLYIKDNKGILIDSIRFESTLKHWQFKSLKSRPKLIWQFAHKIKEEYKKNGQDVSVHADIKLSLNGRSFQQFTNPEVDIASKPYPIWKVDWIMPLTTSLPK